MDHQITIYGTVRSSAGIQKELRSVAHNIPVGRYVWERIQLIFLPPYSPNLNIIERLWKFFKKNEI